jgi:glycosyltransferase involved in cell wall biosynthesis
MPLCLPENYLDRSMHTILFYCESPVFGGHEKMAIAAHSAVQRSDRTVQIHWLVNSQNPRLVQALKSAGIDYSELTSERGASLWRHPLRTLRTIVGNAEIMRRFSADLVLVVQGGILLSLGGVIAAKVARLRVCSYIPMVHAYSETNSSRFPYLADRLWHLLYRVQESYITIDSEQARRLCRENPRASVEVVENWIPSREPLRMDRASAKIALGIDPARKVISVVGRIDFRHKCQDQVIRSLRGDPFLDDKLVLFVGDGPDAAELKEMIDGEPEWQFKIMGWKHDLYDTFSATDVLLLPSRVEGVPLVMLEALGFKIPVVGTDRDGMKSWLPCEWRFAWNDVEGLKAAISRALGDIPLDIWESIDERLRVIHDEGRFGRQFLLALHRYCGA